MENKQFNETKVSLIHNRVIKGAFSLGGGGERIKGTGENFSELMISGKNWFKG